MNNNNLTEIKIEPGYWSMMDVRSQLEIRLLIDTIGQVGGLYPDDEALDEIRKMTVRIQADYLGHENDADPDMSDHLYDDAKCEGLL